jgi:hypothetical protein
MPLFDLCMQLRHALIVKRHFTAHQDIKDDAETPYVDLGPGVLLGLQEFGCGKVQAPAECLELAPGREEVAQAKIDDLDVASLANQNVLNLQVAMDDAVTMAVVECTGNLAGEFASLFFLETTVRDDVVEHLTTVYKLEQHVPVVVCPDDILHATDVGVVEQADNGGFSRGSDFLGVVGSLAVGSALVLVLRLSGNNLDGRLCHVNSCLQRESSAAPSIERGHARTCSPDSECFASLTFPMLPAPMVFPRAHVPVLGAVMVVLRLVVAGCICAALPSTATPLTGMAEAVDASDAYRAWPLLLDSVRVGVGAARSFDSLRRTWSFATLVCSQSRAATLFRPCCWRECEAVLGREAVLCERWGRSEGLA